MSVSELELRRLNDLLEQKSWIKAFESLQSEVQETHKPPRTSVATRAEEWKQALAKMDDEKLIAMQETMSNYVDLIAKHEVDFGEFPKELTGTQRVQLMQGVLWTKEIKEFLDVYQNWVRSAVFSVITEQNTKPGVEYPEYAKGEIPVRSLGKRFCKEGGNRKAPTLNYEKLREELGEELYNQCVSVEVKRVETFSIEELMKLAETDPSVLEKIRKSLKPGDFGANSFTVRDIKD